MERTSQASAEKYPVFSYVLLLTDGDTDISNSVWTKIEKTELIASEGKFTRIIKVDPNNFNSRCILWDNIGNSGSNMANCNADNGLIPCMFKPFVA